MTENVEKVQNKKRRTVAEPKVSVSLKRLWTAEGSNGESLKVFAKRRAKGGDALAKRWLENCAGKHDVKRSEKNAGLAKLIGETVKQARKKIKK